MSKMSEWVKFLWSLYRRFYIFHLSSYFVSERVIELVWTSKMLNRSVSPLFPSPTFVWNTVLKMVVINLKSAIDYLWTLLKSNDLDLHFQKKNIKESLYQFFI
jgi:hypothetical protein